jgi:hypothetical protein
VITYEKLSIYARYNGSNDLFLRIGSEHEHQTLTTEDWIILYKFEDFYNSLDETQPLNQHVVEFEQDMLTYCSDATVFLYTKQVIERHRRDRLNPPLLQRLSNWILG